MGSEFYQLISATEEKKAIAEKLSKLSEPKLKDLTLVKALYDIFSRNVSQMGSDERRIFVFIAVWLFSPSAIAGECLKSGLRTEIAKVLDGCSLCNISNAFANAKFQYFTYRSFRNYTNQLYDLVLKDLEKNVYI